MTKKIGIIGLGVVGNAVFNVINSKGYLTLGYDKFKDGGIGSFEDCLKCDVIFLCLPTPYSYDKKGYDLGPLKDVLNRLDICYYTGVVVIKSTITPGTSNKLSKEYKSLSIVHNPEFLTARNAELDFENQTHIVLGKTESCINSKFIELVEFYKKTWPNAIVSTCNSGESETMKLGCNTFYAVKIQYLTELYLLCQKENLDFDKVKSMMIINKGMGPNYTNVPGHDGSISYSGMCFPKDTNALCSFMKDNKIPCSVLDATIKERNLMRDDQKYENTSNQNN